MPGTFRPTPRALHLLRPFLAFLPLHLFMGPPHMNSALAHMWSLIGSPIVHSLLSSCSGHQTPSQVMEVQQ